MTLLSDLVTTLRQRTDTVASEFVADSELDGYLNASLAELDDLMIGTSEDYKVTLIAVTVANSVEGSNYFTLPADFLKSRGVDRLVNGSSYLSLPRFEMAERNRYAAPFTRAVPGFLNSHYRLEGTKCWIIPASSAAGSYRLWYVPRYTVLAHGGTIPDYMDEQAWHEYAIADAGAKVQQKQELDPSVFLAQKAALQARIVKAASTRDAGPPRKMVDTRGVRAHGRFGWPRGSS